MTPPPQRTPPSRAGSSNPGSSGAKALAALLVAVCALGCAGNETDLAEGEPIDTTGRANTVVIGVHDSFESVNELIAAGSAFNDAIVDRLFLQLVDEIPDYSSGPATFSPRLARSWEFSTDRLELTFELRDDVRWSDGTPVSAEDVRFTWQAQTHPEVAWNYSFVKESIDDVEVLGPGRVRFHFAAASASQLMDANEGVILPAHVWGGLPFEQWRQEPAWFEEHLVTDGPFLLESIRPGEQISLVRNEDYYEPGLPHLDRVVFRRLADQTILVEQLLAGELDMVRMPSPSDIERIEASPHLVTLEYPHRQFDLITWNTSRPPLDDPAVRRALALAVDRETIVETLFQGHATVASSPIVSWAWPHPPDLEPWAFDPDAARELLEERGWTSTDRSTRARDGVPLQIEILTNPGSPLRWNALQMIQAQLGEVGVGVELRQIDYNTLMKRNVSQDFDATLLGLLMDTSLDLGYLLHSDSIGTGYNFGAYSDPEVDALIDQANAALDKRDAEAALVEIQWILHREQPLLFLWEPRGLVAIHRRLLDVRPDSLSEFSNLREWRVAEQPSRSTAARGED